MNFSVVSAVNDTAILESCLLRSPDLSPEVEVILQRGYRNASTAYNQALDSAKNDIVVFAHQDLFLPPGWRDHFEAALSWLALHDPSWGVLGICGLTASGQLMSWVYSNGLGKTVGGPFASPAQVRTLDEVMLVVRKSSHVRFDDTLPGFHMYGTDICLTAEQLGLRNYAIPCFAVHNSNGIKALPWAFWKAYLHVWRKWFEVLPVYSPCTVVSKIPVGIVKQTLERNFRYALRRKSVGVRAADPYVLYQQLDESTVT